MSKKYILEDVRHFFSLFGKAGVRIMFESNKMILAKNDAFVGK
ncbi:hypothetical protein CK203_013808 [Vitis vinifera]|uniref:Uncharacterized protein n=1 Tax=Vitis vinifera TaxID=29760 RepID=A0A438JJA2_VITVI|nr:hypothetical protein CK203_013808 [Vitis vinifera]